MFTVGGESTGWNDTVDVRMEQHVLSPRVQDCEEANLSAKMPGIPCNFQKGLGHALEEHVIKSGLILEDQCV